MESVVTLKVLPFLSTQDLNAKFFLVSVFLKKKHNQHSECNGGLSF